MSAAEDAYREWADTGNKFFSRGGTPKEIFVAGFAAGEIHSLEAMADEAERGNYHGELVWVWLRNVAQIMREDAPHG